MNREYHRWFSPNLGREMELLIFGHAGEPVLIFPTSMGRFYEFEDRGLVDPLAGRIERGEIQLFCVDSVDRESWYAREHRPADRVARHLAYERYLLDEVLPLIRSHVPWDDQRIIVTGCSLGAFHAAELAFRHPDVVKRLVALSGKYDNSSFMSGYSDSETYLTNPLAFLPNLSDAAQLEALRHMDIVVVSGSTDPHIAEARHLSKVLWERGVPNKLDVWEGWMHDWPYWEAMYEKHL